MENENVRMSCDWVVVRCCTGYNGYVLDWLYTGVVSAYTSAVLKVSAITTKFFP